MNPTIVYTVASLSSLGLIAAAILYVFAQKFKVYEDPRIDEVQDILPAANCGGCGYAGCRNFAEALVKADSFDGLNCPPGGSEVMEQAAAILGREAVAADPLIAVVRCGGTPDKRPLTSLYDGVSNCKIANSLYTGESDCGYGCLGLGDCVASCQFDAMHMDNESRMPVISDTNCVACGACVKACPRSIIVMRKKAKKDRKLFVSCVNRDKGAVAKKACSVACIGCSKCVKVCEYDAVKVENFLSYIDYTKCVFCRKCVTECPNNAIVEINFPPRKVRNQEAAKA